MCSPAGGGPAFPGRRRPNPLQSRGAVAGAVTLPGRAGLSDKRSASGGGARRYRSPAPPIPPTLPQLPRASDPFNTDGLRGGSQGQGGHAPPHPPTHTPSTQTPSTHSTHPSTYPHSKHPPSPPFRLTRADTGARRVAAAAWARAGPSGLRLGPVGRRPLAGRSRL